MEQVEISLEKRFCKKCGKNFKVMKGSPTEICSRMCAESGMQVRGAPQRALKENGKEIESIKVSVGKATKPTEKLNMLIANVCGGPTQKARQQRLENGLKTITEEINRNKTQEEQSGDESIKSDSLKTKGNAMLETAKDSSKKYTKPETEGIQPESFVEPSKNLELVRSGLLDLQLRSANRLLNLMEATVTDSDLERSKEETRNLELYKVEVAIKCANAITNIVQANINLFKAVNKI